MKIIMEIGHPAHVHTFKHAIRILRNNGHDVRICAADKDQTLVLLNAMGLEHDFLGVNKNGRLLGKLFFLLQAEYRMLRIARRFRPDLFVSRGSPVSAHISRILKKPHIVFNDTECAIFTDVITLPFSDTVCTPTCFKKDFGRKQVRFNGYKELAYLHPDYYQPDNSILGLLGLTTDARFVILRFVAWQATHDFRQHGLNVSIKRTLINELGKSARVFIISENTLPDEFKRYMLDIPPHKIHDLLYYGSLYVGEGATMATEAAILGTPSVYISSLSNTLGNLAELEYKYDMVYSFRDPEKAMRKAMELLRQSNSKAMWIKKRRKLLADKIDVTRFMVDFIDNYPQSFYKYGCTVRDVAP
jgi:predicted glycosyltransferase